MAFRNDPIIVGLGTKKQATSTPRSGVQRDVKPGAGTKPGGGAKPDAGVKPDAGAKPETSPDPAEECRQAYADFREVAARTERRWQWIAAISGAAGVGLGAAVGVWQARRRAAPALPESK